MEIQSLPRAVNELLILSAIRGGAKHGYQIALDIEERSEGFFSFNHGTLYPILHQLEKEGLIDGTWDEGRGRQKRRTYSLTATGQRRARALYAEWGELVGRVSALVETSAKVRSRAAADQR